MSFKTEFDGRICTTTYTGQIDEQILRTARAERIANPEWSGCKLFLLDFSKVERFVARVQMPRVFANEDQERSQNVAPAPIKVAYAIARGKQMALYGDLRVWQQLVKGPGMRTGIFASVAEAKEWLLSD